MPQIPREIFQSAFIAVSAFDRGTFQFHVFSSIRKFRGNPLLSLHSGNLPDRFESMDCRYLYGICYDETADIYDHLPGMASEPQMETTDYGCSH